MSLFAEPRHSDIFEFAVSGIVRGCIVLQAARPGTVSMLAMPRRPVCAPGPI